MARETKPAVRSAKKPAAAPARRAAPKPPKAKAEAMLAKGSSSAGRLVASYDDIARRAYEIWQSRGGSHGDHVADWLQAEQEMCSAQLLD